MTEAIGTAGGGHPDLNLNADEKRVYGELLREADPDGFGAVSGDVAVKFFERTKLQPDVLGQIWQIADTENRGFLTPAGFGVVLRLIGHAQAGRVPAASLAAQPAPLPRFMADPTKQPPPAAAPPLTSQLSGTPSSPSASLSGPIRVPPLAPEKVNEYAALFEKSGAENGALSGLVAKQIFERARLPNEVLGRIWFLADTQSRGFLDVTEFVIAMHLLASYKSGQMRGVPSTLPPGLYEAASRRPPPRMAASPPGSRAASVIQPQSLGFAGVPQSPIARQQAGTPISTQTTGEAWSVSPADKARFDQIFATIDRQGMGYINGEQAVSFFGNARLPEETLAQIWDLADINSEGRLNREQFAVAMYLIRQQRGTKDGRGVLPSTLPPALIPPSMRKQVIPPSQPTAPAFENAPITQPRSAAEDLFGLDVLAPTNSMNPTQPIPAPTQVPQSTGGTDVGPFGSPQLPQASPAAPPAPSTIFAPFQPSSRFGQSMLPQSTGSPGPNQSRSLPTQSAGEDLLSDGDTTVSSKLTNETAELGNLSNQIGTLSKEMTDLQGKRAQADQELSQNAQQKRTFETRLSQLRTAFEKEVQEFKAIQEQLNVSRAENKRLQQDIAMIEGSHADTKRQHEQLRTAYEADQQENATLKEKIRQINAENDQMKPQIEKLKSDARQQKGLVAINKKQLATNELERDRLKQDLAAVQKEVEDATREIEESNRQLEASKRELEAQRAAPKPTMPVHVPASVPVAATDPLPTSLTTPEHKPTLESRSAHVSEHAAAFGTTGVPVATPPLSSPTPSNVSNPFMRRDTGAAFSPPMGSPEPTTDHSAFDSIFGPAFGGAAGATTTPAPATSFGSGTPIHHPISHEHATLNEAGASVLSRAPEMVEPPAPPINKQITSDALPFRAPLERSESVTSSVKVVPPASRLSPADTPRAGTPVSSSSKTEHQKSEPIAMAAADEEQESVRQSLPRADTSEKLAEIPGAFPVHTPLTDTPASTVNQTSVTAGAGAVTLAAGTGLVAAASHHEEVKQNDEPVKPPVAKSNNNFDEYFGGPAHQRTTSEQVKDFDDAFASMKTGPATAATVAGHNNKEFPDIQELDDVDSSSDYSDETPLGFDDDFNANPTDSAAVLTTKSTSNPGPISSKAAGKLPETASAVPTSLRPQLETASSTTSSLPGIEQQTSPPTYKDSVPQDNPTHFPMEYKGLLPEREDPASPTLSTTGAALPNPSLAYGPETVSPYNQSITETAAPSSKTTAFDFDSAFAGMGPAQVEEDDSDDHDTTFGSHRNAAADFDPTFDSPFQSRAPTVASVTHSPKTTHSAVTNGAPSNTAVSTSNFYGFNNNIATSSTVNSSNSNNVTAVSHDWDALFAPLDSSNMTGSNSVGESETQKANISSDENVRNSAPEVAGNLTSNQGAMLPVKASPLPSSNLKVDRPQPGRALSTGTEHDDPILKRLTAMGWNRAESLAALEKFDYNIDKAADFLTFRS